MGVLEGEGREKGMGRISEGIVVESICEIIIVEGIICWKYFVSKNLNELHVW